MRAALDAEMRNGCRGGHIQPPAAHPRHEEGADAAASAPSVVRRCQFTEPWMDFWKTGVLFASNL